MPGTDHDIGALNKKNGICGFAASVYMAAKIDPTRMPTRDQGNLARRTLVEIAYFLKKLKTDDNQLFREIEAFTRSFGEQWKNFNIDDFITRCNESVTVKDEVIKAGGYDVAMTPKAVAAYLKEAWEIDAMVLPVTGGSGGNGNCILGLCENGTGDYGDLKHWVYRHNGVIYSYGLPYPSLSVFNKQEKENYKVG